MEEAPLLDGMSSPEDEIVPDLFSADRRFAPENMPPKAPVAVKAEEDEFRVFRDTYLGPADPREPLLHAFNPPLNAGCSNKATGEFLVDENDEEEMLGGYPSLPELNPLEDAALPTAPLPSQAYNVHFLSSLLTPHRNPAVVSLGAWAREGAAHPGVRVIPVERKEGGGTVVSTNPEEAGQQGRLAQEPSGTYPSPQEAEDNSGCSHWKDSNPMVICQLKGGTQMLCLDNSGTRELKALHLVPQYQDQNNHLQSDVPKPLTTLVGRFLPVPAKLNLITQQLDNGASVPTVNGSAFPSGPGLPGPPKMTLARYCDGFAGGDFCNNCNCDDCCNNLHHELERCKAIKERLDRNPGAFPPKTGKGELGAAEPRGSPGCSRRRPGCPRSRCARREAQMMCSSVCKCTGCRNDKEGPERKVLMTTPNCAEIGGSAGSHHLSPTKSAGPPRFRKERRPLSCISWEVVETACACLLAQGEEAEKERCPECVAQQRVLEEFGRCLSQILHIEFKSRGLKME